MSIITIIIRRRRLIDRNGAQGAMANAFGGEIGGWRPDRVFRS